jgi:very-short-patch-repair endonuclease
MFTEDVLRRKSESMVKTCSDPEYRANMSRLRKIDWEEGKYDDAHIALSKALKAAHARGCYDGVQGNPSKLELDVLAEFRLFGVEAVGQYRPDGCSFVYDIYLPEYQTLVEVDGEYWHYSEMAKEKGVAEQDAEKDDWALSNGFDIVRLPEAVLHDHGIVESVDSALGMLT